MSKRGINGLFFGLFLLGLTVYRTVLWAHPTQPGNPNTDSSSYYQDSIQYGSDYREKGDFIAKAIAYSQRRQDTLSLYRFELERGNLLFMQGHYLDARDTLIALEKAVAASMDRPSLLEDGGAPFISRTPMDSIWRELHVDVTRMLAQVDVYLRETAEAVDIVTNMRRVYSLDSADLISACCYNAMGVIYARNNQPVQALPYYHKAYDLFVAHNDLQWQAMAAMNLAYTYLGMKQADTALHFAMESYTIFKKIPCRRDKYINSELCLAVVYHAMQQYKLAEGFYLTALQDAEDWQCVHLLLYIRNHLMGMLLETGQYQRVAAYAQVNLQDAREAVDFGAEETALLQLSRIYALQGDSAHSLDCLQKAYQVSKKVVQNDEVARLTILQRKFDSYRQVQEQRQYEQALELTNAKLRNSLWATAFILLLGLAMAVTVVIVYRRLRVQKRMNQIIKLRMDEAVIQSRDRMDDMQSHVRQVLDDKQKVLSEKDRELTAMALYHIRIEGLMETIGEKLRAMQVLFNLKTKEKMYISEIERLLKSMIPDRDRDWNEFELYFKQTDREFFDKLEARFPKLTPNEKRLCALVHLNLSAKEIATITNRSYHSVNMAKSRLKKKFGCPPDRRLYDFLMQL